MGDYTPVNNVDSVTFTATATITGGQLVTISGNNSVAPSTTGDRSVGVALHDAASGGRVTCAVLPGAIHELTIQGVVVIAAGNDIVAGTTGTINKGTLATDAAAGTLLGICVSGGTGPAKARFIGV
jgi:hypothetical protein